MIVYNVLLVVLKYCLGDGSVRIWKDYAIKGRQKLATGFSSIQAHKPGARGLNAVVDWQQQSGYLVYGHFIYNMQYFYFWSCETWFTLYLTHYWCLQYVSGESSSIMLWDLEKEQLLKSVPSESECSVTALVS